MRTSLKVGVVAAFAFVASATAQAGLNLPAMQCSYSFPTDMGLGARSTSVMDLQKVLNMYPETKVASTGAGSPGMETSYFGPATRAAVLKFQSLHLQDTRATGFVGPLTRALLNKVCSGTTGGVSGLPAGCSSTSGFSPLTGQSCGSGTGTSVSGSGLTVTAGSNVGGTIIAQSAQVPVLNFKLSNPSAGEVTVNSLKFMRLGTVSDSSIANGYLASGNQIVGQYTSLSGGIMTFANLNAKIPAGATVDMSLRIDLGSGVAAGNLIGFQLMSANDVVISAGSVGGTFPLVGGNFYTTTVSNPSLATVSSAVYQGVGNQVDAGATSFRAGAVTVNIANNPVKFQSVRFNVNGSINPSTDLANLKLRIDGQEVAAGMVSGSSVFFDLGSMGKVVNTGSHIMEVYADVLGTPNRTFTLEILRPYDVVLMDTQYNSNISFGTPTGTATQVTVRAGNATVALSSDTPTGTIPLGGSNVTLAKFRVYAAGEALRIKFLPFKLTQTGGNNWAALTDVDADLRNIALYGDDGVQIGSTINTPSGCSYSPAVNGTTEYTCGFGSSSANINYTIPANTSRVLSLKADVQTTANFTTIKAALTAATSNVEGQISFKSSSLPAGLVQGNALSLTLTPFQVARASFGDQTIVGGAVNQKIAAFSLSASSAEAINLTSVSITASSTAGSNSDFRVQNLAVKVDGNTWNYVQASIDPNGQYTFSAPSLVQIPAGGSKNVEVFADVLQGSVAGSYRPVSFTGAVAQGAMTNTVQNLSGAPVTSQLITVAGAGTLSAAAELSSPLVGQIVLGKDTPTVGQALGQFRFSANNNEDIRIKDLTLTVTASAAAPATFDNLMLKDGSTVVGTCNALVGGPTVYTAFCTLSNNGLVIAKSNSKNIMVVGDVATYNSSQASAGKDFTVSIAASADIRAEGAASTGTVTVGGTYPMAANTQTVLRTKGTVTLAAVGPTTGRTNILSDHMANLTITPDAAGALEFRSITLKLSGSAFVAAGNIVLKTAGGQVLDTQANAASVTFTPSVNQILSGPTTYRIEVDTNGFTNVGANVEAFSIQLQSGTDIVLSADSAPAAFGTEASFGIAASEAPKTVNFSY